MRLGLVYILELLYFIPGVIFIAFLIPLSIYFDLFPLVLIIRGEIVWLSSFQVESKAKLYLCYFEKLFRYHTSQFFLFA